jgi:hypothetical protein
MRKNNLLVIILYVIIFIFGCDKNPFSPVGIINVGSDVIQNMPKKSPSLFRDIDINPDSTAKEISVNFKIEKIEISNNEKDWIIISENTQIILTAKRMQTSKWEFSRSAEIKMPLPDGDYPYIRIWFGKTVRAYKLMDDNTIIEKTRDDFNDNFYPIVYKFVGEPYPQPIKVNRGRITKLWLFFRLFYIVDSVLGSNEQWQEFKNNAIGWSIPEIFWWQY